MMPEMRGTGPEELPFNEPVGEPPYEPDPYAQPYPAESPRLPADPMPLIYPPEIPPEHKNGAVR